MPATQGEYTTAANAILAVLKQDIVANVPNIFGYQDKALRMAPALAGECAKAAVDALEAAAMPPKQEPTPESPPAS